MWCDVSFDSWWCEHFWMAHFFIMQKQMQERIIWRTCSFRVSWLNDGNCYEWCERTDNAFLLAMQCAHRPLANTGKTHWTRKKKFYGMRSTFADSCCSFDHIRSTYKQRKYKVFLHIMDKRKMLFNIIMSDCRLYGGTVTRSPLEHVTYVRCIVQQQQTQTISNDSWRQFSFAFSSFFFRAAAVCIRPTKP